ncbi:MAG: peptide-methionine (S)-S-oxide reductase MsrA [Gemmatimonadaceae bacterium]
MLRSMIHSSTFAAVALTGVAAHSHAAASPAEATAVFSAGCYWTVEAVFEHVRGVTDVVSGFAGRDAKAHAYSRAVTGTTGAAEAVRVTYDPSKVSYDDLLRVFFTAAHDPTQLNRQGPDVGNQYRSVIFYSNDEQRRSALDYLAHLETSRAFPKPIVTQVAALDAFRPVIESEQDFVEKNPNHPYVVAWDRPRLAQFRRTLPELFREHK